MMSLFNPELPKKQKKKLHHPWEKTIKYAYSGTYKYGHNSANNPVYPQKKEEFDEDCIKFTVIGNRISREFIFCYYLVKLLHKFRRKIFEAPVILGVTSIEWPETWNNLKRQFGCFAHCIESQVAVLMNDELLGGEKQLKKFIGSKYIYHLCIDYYKEGIQQFANYIKSSGRPCAYMQLSINGKEIGTMIFMLYADIVPLTCENFMRLCEATRGGYAGTPVHRIVEGGWIQCGGFGLKDNPSLDCDNYIVKHDRRGVICMANDGRNIDCSTQFFVLLQPASWMAHKYVAFGQLIEGEATLRKIESVPTWYESPTADIIIYKAGIFNMDCHWIPINKNTHEYIHSHIENLFEIGELFYKELLQKVFMEIEFRYIQRLQTINAKMKEELEDQGLKNVHEIKSFLIKKSEMKKDDKENKENITSISTNYSDTSISGAITENKNFDVDEYKYKFEEYTYSTISLPSEVREKPDKPFYIPLTDVPYPGEVESKTDIQKLLRGDLCHEADVIMDSAKRLKNRDEQRRTSIPETIISALFECEAGNESDRSLDSEDENEIKNYLTENGDSASFAGRVIKKIANLSERYAIFDEDKKHLPLTNIISDDQLRIIRMAEMETKLAKKKHVSISLSASRLSHTKIQRRETRFVRMSDIAANHGVDSEIFEKLEEESDLDERVRKVRITVNPSVQAPRPSVLARLYFDVKLDEDYEAHRLKDFRPSSEQSYKSKIKYLMDDSLDRMLDLPALSERHVSIDKILTLQHGNRISRNISFDYVGANNKVERQRAMPLSLKSLEFAKKRPKMSVMQYKEINRQYREKLDASSREKP